jgi:anti-sigma factor (TIGR02949 family)
MSIVDKLKSLLGLAGSDDVGASNEEMISCEEALSLVHDFLDGELDSVPASRVKAHFDVCQRCYPHLHLERVFREAMRSAAAGESIPADLRGKVAMLIAEAEAQD